jgi:hypothetical protein
MKSLKNASITIKTIGINSYLIINRYMAAADLCSEILKSGSGVVLEEGMEKRICQAFMAHLSDKSLDVQGNAVKCI